MSRKSINEQLREAIEGCGKSRYRISQESGVSQAVLSRFVNGQTELTIANAERLCQSVGVKLVLRTTKNK
jgi:transcriptional regulator with XRE-family HTH domain